MIYINDLSFGYDAGAKKPVKKILENLNLEIRDNEFFCVLGPSGCGKSTLLKVIAGFEKQTAGTIVDSQGKNIEGISYERAMVFQEDAVFPWLTVCQNVEYGPKMRGVPAKERKALVQHYIDLVGLKGVENMYPKELSGGMKKRVDLARVLANDPMAITLVFG